MNASENHAALRREFRASLSSAERIRTLVGVVVATVFWLGFTYLDYLIYPDSILVFFQLRIAVLVVFWIAFMIAFRTSSYAWAAGSAAIAWTCATAAIAVMCHLTEGYASPYYAGIVFCAVFAGAILLWPTEVVAACFSVTLLVYFGPIALGAPLGDRRIFLLNTAFLVATLAISVLATALRQRMAFAAFLSRRELAQSHADLELLDASKNRMFQNVSHELRTPLTLMLSPLQKRLESDPPQGVEPEQARTLYRNGLRLLRQVDDLLALANLSAEKVATRRTVLDLGKFLSDLAEDAQSAAETRGISIELALPETPLYYSVDSDHLEQIVLNLLSNAIKFSGQGSTVRLTCLVSEFAVEISVADTGPGIDSTDQSRIFERFEQGSAARLHGQGGAGIGLALVREFTELLGGEVRMDSTPGHGTSFVILLPKDFLRGTATPSAAVPTSEVQALGQHARRTALHHENFFERLVAGTSGPRLLIAEDDPDLRSHLVELLGAEHRVIAVSDGEVALAEAMSWKPHLVITDVMMPGLDGVELCRRLREDVTLENTAVLMLTARTSLDDRVDGRRAGADSYLTKPFQVAELEAAVEGLLRARHHLVGDFLVQRPLGSGGQSRVFLAEHRETGRIAAVKRITAPRAISSARRLRSEIEALERLDHPNIVKVLAGYEQQGEWYLAMEYLSGTTVSALVERESGLRPTVAAAVGSRVASALDAVHQAGLLHRDVKCSNIMLLTKNTVADGVRLIDFGSVGLRDQELTTLCATFPYLAPEIAYGTAPWGPLSDVYSLGVALFKMCAGRLPYPASSLESLRQQLRRDSAARIPNECADCPPSLREVIERAMALDANERFPSAAALAEALAGQEEDAGGLKLRFASAQPDILTPTDSISGWSSSAL